jgi:hypothetical protein
LRLVQRTMALPSHSWVLLPVLSLAEARQLDFSA